MMVGEFSRQMKREVFIYVLDFGHFIGSKIYSRKTIINFSTKNINTKIKVIESL